MQIWMSITKWTSKTSSGVHSCFFLSSKLPTDLLASCFSLAFLVLNPCSLSSRSVNPHLVSYRHINSSLAGDVRCRFNYTEVAPASYGLAIDDILNLTDKELNQRSEQAERLIHSFSPCPLLTLLSFLFTHPARSLFRARDRMSIKKLAPNLNITCQYLL